MKRVAWLGGLLVVLMVVLSPVAWASPPDPTWAKGIFDDADFDDVVAYVTCSMIGIPGLPVVEHVFVVAHAGAGPVLDESSPPAPPASTRSPRVMQGSLRFSF